MAAVTRAFVVSVALLLLAACSEAGGAGDAANGPFATTNPGATATTRPAATAPGEPPPIEPPSGRRLGAVVDGDGVVFRVWAPAAKAAWVVGEVTPDRVAMHAEADLWVTRIAGARAGQTYRYAFDRNGTSVERVDPYCREVKGETCLVVDPSAYVWRSKPFARPARNATVAYELHVGSFSVPPGADHGTFASTRAALPRLAELGVNAIEMMPVQDFGGGATSWGYNPQLFFAPKASYGTSDDLRALVDDAHASGIAAWIDVVYNHTDGFGQAPLRCFDGDCTGGAAGVYFFPNAPYANTPWGPRPDYTKKQVSDMILDSVHVWLTEHRGDGFRWDSVSNIRALDGQGETPGGKDLLVRANDWTHKLGGTSVAEDLKGYDAITKGTGASGGFGFDTQWDGFGYTVMDVLSPYTDDGRDLGRIQGALQGSYAGDPFARLLFIEDHDTVGNGGSRLASRIDAANPESFAARKRSMLGAAMLLTAPGLPMIFMGQEDLASGGFVDPPTPLPAAPTAHGAMMHAFYKDMIRLRRNLDGGTGGLMEPGVDVLHRNDTSKVLAYRRHGASGEDVIVVLNLRNAAYTRYDIGVPDAAPWKVRVDADDKRYGDDFGGGAAGSSIAAIAATKDGKPFTLPLALGPYGTIVLTR